MIFFFHDLEILTGKSSYKRIIIYKFTIDKQVLCIYHISVRYVSYLLIYNHYV